MDVPAPGIVAALRSPGLPAARDGLRMLEAALDAGVSNSASNVALAVACVDALVSFVVREDLEKEDFRRGSLRACSLMAMDKAVMRHMIQEGETFWPFFAAPCGGLAALHKKAPGDLTAEDAYDVACQISTIGIMWGWGIGYLVADGPEDVTEPPKSLHFFGKVMGFDSGFDDGHAFDSTLPLITKASDASIERISLLALELIRGQDQQDAPAPRLVLAGMWYTVASTIPRYGPATALIGAGVFEVAAAVLKKATPLERISRIAPLPLPGQPQQEGGVAGAAMVTVQEMFEGTMQRGGHGTMAVSAVDSGAYEDELVTRLLDLGIWEMAVDNLRAFEMLGSNWETASVSNMLFSTWWMWNTLDWTSPAVQPFVEMLRQEPRAIRFALDHPMYQCFGCGTSAIGTGVIAVAFGRYDGGQEVFTFSQRDIDELLTFKQEILRPGFFAERNGWREGYSYGMHYAMWRNQAQSLLALCISDSHKKLLLTNPNAVTHLVYGLMLDPAHHRTGERDPTNFEGIKTAVQRDYAECLQQLSLFPEGKEAMIRDPSVTEALRELVSGGDELCWSDNARRCARGALMALEGRDQEDTLEEERRWVMLSYNWDHQKTFIRLNAALKGLGYWTCELLSLLLLSSLVPIPAGHAQQALPTSPACLLPPNTSAHL